MDIFVPIIIFIIAFILLSICGFCCKRKREGTVYGLPGTNVTVSTQPISASPVVVPPYPVEPRHPTPGAVPPGPGFATHHPPYPTHTPHPVPAPMYYPPAPPVGTAPYTSSTGPAPYPPVGVTPYPPTGPPLTSAPFPDYSVQPPSYSEAVSQPSLPTKEGYSKQAPYNPNY